MLTLFATSLAAFLIAALLIPVVMKVAVRWNLVDSPDGHRKLQTTPIALGGGAGVLIATFAAILIALAASSEVQHQFYMNMRFLIGLAGATTLICLVGLIDDAFELRGRQKLLGQCVTVFVIVLGGLVIEEVELFGWHVKLGLLSIPFTMLWLLGTVNALNLIDGVDGLAGSVGVIFSVTLAIMSAVMGHFADALCAAAFAGALGGFLIYNLPPARIYLGDAGSMTIGLAMGALAIRSSLKGPATAAMAAPVAIWAVLIFDVGAAIVRRKLTGQSIYASDRGHMHHVLQKKGFGRQGTVLFIAGLCLICAVGAMVSVFSKSEMMAVGTGVAVIAALIVTRFFGHSEAGLLIRRVRSLLESMMRFPMRRKEAPRPVLSRFGGNRDWESLWDSLVEFAERFDLSLVQLNVNAPSIGEEYHAMWERKAHPPLIRMWRTEVPLFSGKMAVGRLTICGTSGNRSACEWMGELIEGLKPFEDQLNSLLATDPGNVQLQVPPAPHISPSSSAQFKLPIS
jgi:UDP-GlcNAc:undecaprenyl-phosphate GlcNAc-1-phosphate transferase